jgi:hypothetical protein
VSAEPILEPEEWADDPSRTVDAGAYFEDLEPTEVTPEEQAFNGTLYGLHDKGRPAGDVLGTHPRARPLVDVVMRPISWFEKPLWQESAFELLAGAKGAGKGTYLASLGARRTNAGRNVLFVSSEDSAAIDLKPRLVAAGADIARCFDIVQHIRLPEDVELLRELALELGGIGLLVIDPVANHIGNSNSNSDAEVRHAIAPLNRLADELDCLIIGVRHPGKDRRGGALASILGSVAWVDTPRAVVMIAADNEDPLLRHIQVVAGNRSLNGSAQAFRIEAVPVEGLEEPITVAIELGESAKSVDDLFAIQAQAQANSRTTAASDLILVILEAEGAQESDALDARVARETGLAAKTIRNTRGVLKNEGLIRSLPDKDEFGEIVCWKVYRTAAAR